MIDKAQFKAIFHAVKNFIDFWFLENVKIIKNLGLWIKNVYSLFKTFQNCKIWEIESYAEEFVSGRFYDQIVK